MKKIIVFLLVFVGSFSQVLAQSQQKVDENVHTEDFLNMKKVCCLYHIGRNFKCSNGSIVPYLYYEYTVDLYKEWEGILIAVPKKEPLDLRIKYARNEIDGNSQMLQYFYDFLFNKEMLLNNYDLYVFYVPFDQLTNVNDTGDVMLLIDDNGNEIYDWMKKEDAVASVYHYEDEKWQLTDYQETNGFVKRVALNYALQILGERFK
ncbi:MAG: hypothetical protein IKV67_09890 [Paludibacteraceae bacterium]|nr:hypothetical protein [Paludibacteraceae bacterium]